MKLLLDEQLDKSLKAQLSGVEVFTLQDMGWLGYKNGELREQLNENGFHFFVTADKNLPFQQNFDKINFTIILFDTPSMRRRYQHLFIAPIQSFLNTRPNELPKLVHISIAGVSTGKKIDLLSTRLPKEQILFLKFEQSL
jgi:hypothetical protein